MIRFKGWSKVCCGVALSVIVTCVEAALPSLPPPVTDAVPANDATTGTMAGQAGTDGGAATYSVPIVIPPGRAGMQPSLALNYNSRGGNGIMGVGWTLSGLSSVHRCPQTLEQDGQTLGVSYGGTDRLCLDGQRLVAVSGVYGAANTQYRTEIDSYARVIQVGGGLTGSATCFRVERKDGSIFHYGAVTSGTSPSALACAASTANSRVLPGGAPSTSSWLVEKIEDRVGNNQLYSYAAYGNGENLLSTVTYTGSSAGAGDRSVVFAYEARTTAASGAQDVSSSYLAGALTMQTQALQSITTKVGASVVRTYTPSYYVSQYSGRLFMTGMQECATSGAVTACHPKTQFVFNDDALNTPGNFPIVSLQGFGFSPSTTFQNVPFHFNVIGDLDGDGTKEVLVTVQQSDGQHLYLAQMTGDRQIHTGVDITTVGFGTIQGLSSDIDGSGRSAMIKLPVGSVGAISFGIWNLSRGAIATTNPFLAITSNITFDGTQPNYGQLANIVNAADVDGDGKTDLLIVQPDSTCGSDFLGTQLALFFYRNTSSGQLGAGNTTINFAKQTQHLLCLNRVGAGSSATSYYAPTIDHIADFDGDGIPDIYLVNNGNNQYVSGSFAGIVRLAQSGGVVTATLSAPSAVLTCDNSSVTSTTDECNWQNGYFAHWIDVNGDGLEDFVIARPYQKVWQIRLNKGGTLAPAVTATAPTYAGLDAYPTQTASSPLQGSGYMFRYLNRLPQMDVDGDGKPEILIPQSSTNNTTTDVHGFALKMCTVQKRTLTPASGECPTGSPAAPTPAIDPSVATLQCAIYICPEDPGGGLNLPDNADYVAGTTTTSKKEWNGLPAYGTFAFGPGNSAPDAGDDSVYHLAALKFTQSSTGTFSVAVVNTPLVSRLSDSYGHTEDLFGDGLTDLTTSVGCQNTTVTNGIWSYPFCSVVTTDGTTAYGPTNFPDINNTANSTFANTWALFGNINQGVVAFGGTHGPTSNAASFKVKMTTTAATSLNLTPPILPGLLDAAVNGLGDTAGWAYNTLSVPGAQDSIPFYSVPATGGYVDARHYYFQSSMPAVSGMTQSTGNGDVYGSRASIYGYSQAMYNHYGRGFQGFQTIITETATTSADAARRVRTTTTFNQKFPLVGRVASISEMSTSSARTFHTENDTYVCTLANRGACPDNVTIAAAPSTGGTVFAPVLDLQTAKDFDLASGVQYGETDTVNSAGTASGWDAYGNLTYQSVTRSDKGGSIFVSSHTTTTSNTFDNTDVANWWINKLTNSSVTSAIVYSSTHALPAGASAPNETVTTGYTYNTNRTLATKTIQSGVANQRSTTAYTYPSPSYGLPTQALLCLGSYVAPTCTGDVVAGLSPSRTTAFSYTKDGSTASADGYFVLTTTNAKNQTATTTHQVSDGQILSAKDPNNVQVVTTYDPFGRATQIQHLGNNGVAFETPIQIAYTKCSGGTCPGGFGESSYETYAAYRITTVQAGYPTKVAWYDLLGREIKTAERGYTGTFIDTITMYDKLGTVSEKITPFYAGGAASYFTSWSYDALNRPIVKTSSASDMDATHGDFTTAYTYSGRTTSVTAHGSKVTCPGTAGNLCVTMSRATNVLGQYMQTTDANAKQTNFWTEPHGHVVAITDAEGNLTRATYNAIGERTQSADPDQGTWNFTYDAAGEILTQTDARGVVTAVTARDALGRTTQQQAVPPATIPTGLANETLQDNWTYDPVNGIGELASVNRHRGASTTPGSNPVVWSESYGYEATTARPSTIVTTITEGSAVTLNSSMSYDSDGRPSTHTYPSGLVVQTQYAAYGHPGAIANATTSQIYWEATAMDAWNKVTGESYVDGTTGTIVNYQSTGQEKTASWTLGATTVDSLTYGYDSFSNLISQKRTAGAAINTETYAYDGLQRLTGTSRTAGSVSYGYSASGNLQYKSDYSLATTTAYSYAAANTRTTGCGPHAAYSVALNPSGTVTYYCDANGNVMGGSTLLASYDAANHPRTMSRNGAGSDTWAYDSNGQRDYESSATKGIRYFGPGGYEQVGTQKIHELGPIIVTRNGTTDTITTSLRDRLGSTIDTIDNAVQNTANTRTYDAFGAVRNGDMSVRAGGTLNLNDTIHGFTKHEHADDVRLIHMGGRVYDYTLGRFLNVDPIVGNPLSSQALNPYSYIGNNPLSGIDPTGYYAHCNGDKMCQAEDDSEFLGGPAGKLLRSLTFPGNGAARQGSIDHSHSASPSDIGSAREPVDHCASGPLTCNLGYWNGMKDDVVANQPTHLGTISSQELSGDVYLNGITGDLARHEQLAADHLPAEFNPMPRIFTTINEPSQGGFVDILKVGLERLGVLLPEVKQMAGILKDVQASGHQMDIVPHSGGAALFDAALAYIQSTTNESLSNIRVSYHAGANNESFARRLTARSGIQLFGGIDGSGFRSSPYDIVPQIIGGNALFHPANFMKSLGRVADVFRGERVSPHTLPYYPPGTSHPGDNSGQQP